MTQTLEPSATAETSAARRRAETWLAVRACTVDDDNDTS